MKILANYACKKKLGILIETNTGQKFKRDTTLVFQAQLMVDSRMRLTHLMK